MPMHMPVAHLVAAYAVYGQLHVALGRFVAIIFATNGGDGGQGLVEAGKRSERKR